MLNKRSKKMCPYCGGVHPAEQCPLFMMPPMMPPMAPPMTSPMLPPMMPPTIPPMMPPVEGGMAGGPGGEMMMPEMHEIMERHTQLLECICKKAEDIYNILVSMHIGGAKG